MRKIADIHSSTVCPYARVMIYDTNHKDAGRKDGVYLFFYRSIEDTACDADAWCATLAEAEEMCQIEFGVDSSDWREVDDPKPGCQHDRFSGDRCVE